MIRFLGALFIVFVFIVGIITLKKSSVYEEVKYQALSLVNLVEHNAKVVKHNVEQEIDPSRKRPLSLLVTQSKLSNFLPDVFGKFRPKDWKKFWSIIYEPREFGEGLVKPQVYRSKQEIKDYLMYHYPVFSNFREQHWGYFWNIIFGTEDKVKRIEKDQENE